MPRFAANLSMMFQEHAFLDRFAAARAAGFEAVEFLFPYAFPPEDVAGKLKENGLTQALFNLPPGDWDKGERGFACAPGPRGRARRPAVETGLRYATALDCPRLHLMAGIPPAGADRAACRSDLRRQCPPCRRDAPRPGPSTCSWSRSTAATCRATSSTTRAKAAPSSRRSASTT